MSEIELKEKKNAASKKCLDEKFAREKKMYDLLCTLMSEKDLAAELGSEDFIKLKSYYAKDARGGLVRVDYSGRSILDVFKETGLGVKEVCRKGYTVEGETYVRA